MKNTTDKAILALVLITSGALLLMPGIESAEDHMPQTTATTTEPVTHEEIVMPKAQAKETISGDREEWLQRLILCESSGNPEAVNPVDLDGTPSYGLLQFKPSTFEFFSKAYGIDGELMDPEAQKAIVRRMMDDPTVRWESQFPWCVRKLGRPPQP